MFASPLMPPIFSMTHCSSFGADSYSGKASSARSVNYLKLTLEEKGARVKIAFEINAFCFYQDT